MTRIGLIGWLLFYGLLKAISNPAFTITNEE